MANKSLRLIDCVGVSAAAEILGKGNTTVHYWILKKVLKAYKIEGLQEKLLERREVVAYAKQRKRAGKK